MNKYALTLIAAATSTAILTTPVPVFAKVHKDEPTTFPITIPAIQSHYLFNMEALFVEPTAAAFNANSFTSAGNQVEGTHYNDPIYKWGFKIGGGYIVNQTGNDIQLNWTHLKNSAEGNVNVVGNTSSSSTGNQSVILTGPIGTPSAYLLFSGDSAYVKSGTTLENNAIDLELGQYVNFGSNLSTRWLIGARYAQISGQTKSTMTGTENNGLSTAASFTEHDTVRAKFNGIGPRLGMSANYQVYQGAGIVAAASGFLLAGKNKNFVDADISEVKTSNQSLSTQNNVLINHFKSVVPGFDAKVAVNYVKQTFSHDLSYLLFEVGYQVTDYIGPLNVTTTVGNETIDFGYRGPYLGMNLLFG